MFAPICPLCCDHFSQSAEISACLCGHTFHHSCVKRFRDMTKRFRGFRGCPACGGLKKRFEGKMTVGKLEEEDIAPGDKETTPVLKKRHRRRHRSPIVHLRFSFLDGPRKSLSSTSMNDQRSSELKADNQRLQELLRQAEELEKRRIGEIKGLETKLEALGCLLMTLETQRRNLEDKLKDMKKSSSSEFSSSISIFNNNNNNRSRPPTTSTAPLGSLNLCTDGEALDGSKLILSGMIHLATHALVDYVKSPAIVRRHFGRMIVLSRKRPITPYGRLRGIVSDSVINQTVDAEIVDSDVFEPSFPTVPLPSLPLEDVPRTSSCTSLVDNLSVGKVDSGCQTEFWYDSEWDEDLYEVDWGPDA